MKELYDLVSLIMEEVASCMFTSEHPHFQLKIQEHVGQKRKFIENWNKSHQQATFEEKLKFINYVLQDTYNFTEEIDPSEQFIPSCSYWPIGLVFITTVIITQQFFKTEVLQSKWAFSMYDNLTALEKFLKLLLELYDAPTNCKLCTQVLPITFCNLSLRSYLTKHAFENELESILKYTSAENQPCEKLVMITTSIKLKLLSLNNL